MTARRSRGRKARTRMNDVSDTELFSAYLDGELTADEQVRVEQMLATSPEARQLLEELRALGGTLQGLPQEKLDEDLSARVLEIAERRMLLPDDCRRHKPSAGRAAEALQPPDADSIGWLGIPWREISWRGMFSTRALVWSAVVVATAIIISFNSPPPPKPNQDIARQESGPAAGIPKVKAEPTVAGERRSNRTGSDGSSGVPRRPAGRPTPSWPKTTVCWPTTRISWPGRRCAGGRKTQDASRE